MHGFSIGSVWFYFVLDDVSVSHSLYQCYTRVKKIENKSSKEMKFLIYLQINIKLSKIKNTDDQKKVTGLFI